MANDQKEVAKQIILEIVRQAGGVFHNKTNLFKAFYHAHLRFADTQPGYLSAWPIVRMPRGPGIDQFDLLLGELMASQKIETKQIQWASGTGFRFRLCEATPDRSALPKGAIEAIRFGVNMVKGEPATKVSEDSHTSRAWQEAEDGEELNIYLDSLADDEYRELTEGAAKIAGDLAEIMDTKH